MAKIPIIYEKRENYNHWQSQLVINTSKEIWNLNNWKNKVWFTIYQFTLITFNFFQGELYLRVYVERISPWNQFQVEVFFYYQNCGYSNIMSYAIMTMNYEFHIIRLTFLIYFIVCLSIFFFFLEYLAHIS